jgi:peptidase E
MAWVLPPGDVTTLMEFAVVIWRNQHDVQAATLGEKEYIYIFGGNTSTV